MSQREEGLLPALKREPELSKRLFKLACGGAVGIIAWDTLSALVLPGVITAVADLLLILVYAAVVSYHVVNIVHTMDNWHVQSARQAARLATARRRSDIASQAVAGNDVHEGPAATTPEPSPQAVFHHSIFMMRLQEEVASARRHGEVMAVAALDVTVPDSALTMAVIDRVNSELAKLVATQSQTISLAASVGPTEIVFSLPGANAKGAQSFVSKLVQALGNYWCHYGIAVYPGEATSAESLLRLARDNCEASRQGQSSPRQASAA